MAARQFGAKREARRAVRRLVDLECAVYSELWGEAIAHRVTDVSEEGLWIQTDLLLEIGDEVALTFYPPDWEEPLYVAGRVQRVELQRKPGDGWAAPSPSTGYAGRPSRITAIPVEPEEDAERPQSAFPGGLDLATSVFADVGRD
jgi:hypothetical protein